MADNVKLTKGDVLLREGEDSTSLYWLQKGTLEAKRKKGSEEVILGHVYEGELVGEMSFLDKEPRCATVTALTDCELIEIPNDKFEKLFDSQPKWYQMLIKTLLERLRRSNAKIRT